MAFKIQMLHSNSQHVYNSEMILGPFESKNKTETAIVYAHIRQKPFE